MPYIYAYMGTYTKPVFSNGVGIFKFSVRIEKVNFTLNLSL